MSPGALPDGALPSGSSEVISVDDMKTHLRVDFTEHDTYIGTLIDAVTEQCQDYQRKKYLQVTCIDYLDAWPRSGVIRPRWSPLASVTSIQYIDNNGQTQTWSSDYYDVDNDSFVGRIVPAWNATFPSIRSQIQAVTVTYVAGYGSADDVPDNIKWAIRLWVNALYRAGGTIEADQIGMPQAVKVMLAMDGRVEP